MLKKIIEINEADWSVTVPGGGMYYLDNTCVNLPDVEEQAEDKTSIDQLVQLKSSGYSAAEIIELKKNGLI